ncbi:MAG: thiamine-binding protein [Candidatus Latescibacterota bacterium]|nr:MAG: thiamine-binding protein [Candidatus Latescibacterota bacterium]RKY70689.1 MAG: thiamine-binding protein [Candidatus Latescibacterota bacterium]
MAILEINIVPLGTATPSVGRYIANCLKVLEKSTENYQLTPMGTILEGDLDQLLHLARQMHEVPFQEGVRRVVTTIRIDDRRDKRASSAEKVKSVREKMGRQE